jgi:peptidase M28-like protein
VEVTERQELIRRLCSFEGRRAGTDAERRAANNLAGLLRRGGRRVEIEPTYVHPQWAVAHAGHCALGIAGGLVALEAPVVGFVIVLATAISMYLDLNARLYLLRRLFFRRASQNIVSPGPSPQAPARVILCAHYDAAQGGRAFDPGSARLAARVQAALPFPIGPFRVLFWSLALLLPAVGARLADLEGGWISVLQLFPTLALLVGAFLLVDIALSPITPGANDNASGVATALSLASILDEDPPRNLDVWVLLTGAEECLQEGMRAFVAAHRDDLPRDSTYFVCLDTVGDGDVRFETAAGWVVTFPMAPRLVELCEAIAAADREDADRYRARALRRGYAGDSFPPRIHKYASTTIGCQPDAGYVPRQHTAADTADRIDAAALERAHGFALDVVRLLDRDVGRRQAR